MDFDFGTSEPQKEEQNQNEINTSQPTQQNNEGFLNMDFQSNPPHSQPQTSLDDMLNMNFAPSSQQPNTNTNIDSNFNTNINLNNLNPKVDEEELKRNEAREKEAPPPRKYSRTFVLIHKSFAIKIQINSIFTPKSLRMSNFCCTFAANFKIS